MPYRKLRHILYIEDDAGLGRLLQKRMLARDIQADIALTASEGLQCLAARDYDLTLLDYHLPDLDGLDAFREIQKLEKQMPVVLLTSSGDEKIAVAALEIGMADYAVKDAGQTYLELLPAVMQAAYTKERLVRENTRQKKELTLAKEKAEAANRAKSNFLATMSHEIRTPLNVVTGLTNILAKSSLNDEQKTIVQTLSANAELLLQLIDDLLDISRIESGRVVLECTDFTLSSLLNDLRVMFSEQANNKNIELILVDATKDWRAHADRRRLYQVLMNLVGNALKFTERGSITVKAEIENPDQGTATVRFTIADTGIGIPADKLEHVFEKFAQADETITRKYGGSGLGLAIVQVLLRIMNGTIEVKSRAGEGTVFTVTVPLQREACQEAKVAQADRSFKNGPDMNAPILLVEDYAPNVMVATLMLEDMGYQVHVASSGEEAINQVREAGAPFLAILMDVQMPIMDGLETTRRIRELEKSSGRQRHTIIGVTAHALAGDREKCISAGMDDYISKPIHPDILAATLRRIAGRQAA